MSDREIAIYLAVALIFALLIAAVEHLRYRQTKRELRGVKEEFKRYVIWVTTPDSQRPGRKK